MLPAKLALVIIFITINASTGLNCTWHWSTGELIPSIRNSGRQIEDVSKDECERACETKSDILCHSVNYSPSSRDCYLLVENLQTAISDTASQSWEYALRPRCAGVWFPWSAEKDKILHPSFYRIKNYTFSTNENQTELCMAKCQQSSSNVQSNTACRSIKIHNRDGSCELWRVKEGDKGVTLLSGGGNYQTFNLPAPYLGDSSGSTTEEIVLIGNETTDEKEPHLFPESQPLPVAGYLVAWQYYNIYNTSQACRSYLDVWQNSSSRWVLSHKTELKDTDVIGPVFQYVQDVVHVDVNSFVGTHVSLYPSSSSEPAGCLGNRVSYANLSSGGLRQPVLNRSTLSPTNRRFIVGLSITKTSSVVGWDNKGAAIKAYVAEYVKVTNAPIVSHLENEMKITWEAIPTDADIPLAGYRLNCSLTSDFSSNFQNCDNSLVSGTETMFTPQPSIKPYYTRVQVVRNINGVEQRDLLYSPPSDKFCTAHRRNEVVIQVELQGQITPTSTSTSLRLRITGLSSMDECVTEITFAYIQVGRTQTFTTGTVSKSSSVTESGFTLGQTYTFRVNLKLADDFIIEDGSGSPVEYTVPLVPSAPENLMVTNRVYSSARLSWTKPLGYNGPINYYKIECRVLDNQYNTDVTLDSTSTSTTSSLYRTLGLSPQIKYSCTAITHITSGGYGMPSDALVFWTLPLDAAVARWENGTISQFRVTGSRVVVNLPTTPSQRNGANYKFLQVVAVKSTGFTESTVVTVGEVNLENLAVRTFTIGDGMESGGFANPELTPGFYRFYTRYRAETENTSNVRNTLVPGATNVEISWPTGDPENGTAVVGITGGVLGAAIFCLAAFIVYLKRQDIRLPASCERTRDTGSRLANEMGNNDNKRGDRAYGYKEQEMGGGGVSAQSPSTSTKPIKPPKPDQQSTYVNIPPDSNTNASHTYDALEPRNSPTDPDSYQLQNRSSGAHTYDEPPIEVRSPNEVLYVNQDDLNLRMYDQTSRNLSPISPAHKKPRGGVKIM